MLTGVVNAPRYGHDDHTYRQESGPGKRNAPAVLATEAFLSQERSCVFV
jgi:hypothetical protein